jgi:predicted membrane-bound spermidine synthase
VKQAGSTAAAKGGSPSLGRIELLTTVFITGVAVLTIEVLGTRVIGPVFGVSLFVWSALLAVTLASLAAGYYAGGVLIDRAPSSRLLGTVVVAAGALLGLVRVYSHAVLRVCESLGPSAGALVSALLLFAPTLVALGMTGPIAVRLAISDLKGAGRGAGAIYAVSTAGSLAGVLATAFVIVPRFETGQILTGTALLLVIVGAVSLIRRGKRGVLLAVFVPLIASAVPRPALPADIVELDRAQSLYGLVTVLEDKGRAVRFLRADHSVIGAQFTRDGSPGFSFIHVLEGIRFLRPAAKDLLVVGLGTGSVPSALGRDAIRADVVEIDPAVVRFAGTYFGFSTAGTLFVEDARTFLRRTSRRYDLIVHDTFTGGTTPEHLLSLEVLQRIRDVLQPNGVLALNFAGYQRGPGAEASWAVARTVRAVFPNVRIFRDSPPDEQPDAPGNLVFFASDGPLDFRIPPGARFENQACENVQRSFPQWEVLKQVPDGSVITDARNPLARLQLPIAEEHYQAMNKLLPHEVWLED